MNETLWVWSKRLSRIVRVIVVSLGLAAPVAAEPGAGDQPGSGPPPALPTITNVSPLEVVRGSVVTVSATDLPKDKSDIKLSLGDWAIGAPMDFVTNGAATTGVSFVVPEFAAPREGSSKGVHGARIPFGSWLVRLSVQRNMDWSPALAPSDVSLAFIHITQSVRPPELKLTRVEPGYVPVQFKHLVLVGEGMGGNVGDYTLLLDEREFKLCSEDCSADELPATLASPHQLVVKGPFPKDWKGLYHLSLRAGDVRADKALDVHFMPFDIPTIRARSIFWSILVLVLVAGVAFLVPGKYKIAPEELVDNPTRRFGLFLLDRETDTYSLTLCQFYLWTATAIVAYTYLTLSRIECQGVLELADVPENLPAILGISVAAPLLSAGITKQQGPKAAGGVKPSFSDLISSGGVVLPERFQFLVWTIIAIGSFLLAVFQSDPTSITTLPAIPERLLWLSGVSAAGYLGGKMARRPGPVIDSITLDADASTLTLSGRGLDPTATFELEGIPLEKYLRPAPAKDLAVPKLSALPVTVVAPLGAIDNATTLRIKLASWDQTWLDPAKPRLELTIINRDGQRAAWRFTLDDTERKKLPAQPAV